MTTKPVVLGILGRIGSGKSTACEHLRDAHHAEVFAFAKPLKDLTMRLFDLSPEQVWGTQEQKAKIDPRWGVSPRTMMIRLGDGARETLGKRVWLDACFNQILEHAASCRSAAVEWDRPDKRLLYVIEDMRYENEAQLLHDHPDFHGCVVKLVCPNRAPSPEYDDAPSEVSVDRVASRHIDFLLTSRKTPGSADLKEKIDRLVSHVADPVGRSPGTIAID